MKKKGTGTPTQGDIDDPDPDRLWTARDVAKFLVVSTSWVYHRAEAGLLPVLPRLPGSNLLRFDPVAIKAYARGEWRPPGK